MNRLANESSPYLRQHADNPVDWYTWGEEAFTAAKQLDRPVLLSVGYSACHWCHVMAHESFEDEATAKLMNEWFINIKVDREERPDVDAVYMDVVQTMTGQGGWPMTVFLTPDAKPFFAGTYFPKQAFGGHRSFTDILTAVDDVWRTRRDELESQASAATEELAKRATAFINETESSSDDVQANGAWWADSFVSQLHASHDKEWGGFGGAPKFPPSMAIEALLRAGDEQDLAIVTTTLDAMASGGMYDHLGGGFHRYSVDNFWMVPHFEKMLYDQALVARAYVHAFQRTGQERFRQIAEETINWVLHDLHSPEGGFHSAVDADSEGEEGLFYIWRPEQLLEALDGDATLAAEVESWYGVSKNGNFEGSNILHRPHRGQFARPQNIETARRVLLEARAKRVNPLTDDKVITEWNAMFISTLAESGAALQNPSWIQEAERAAEFLVSNLRTNSDEWMRSWHRETGARTPAFAADYAWLVDMFTRLGEATGKARWRELAADTAQQMIDRFWDDEHGGLFTNANDGEHLIVRQKDVFDGAVPSANSAAAVALTRLGLLNDNRDFLARADKIVSSISKLLVGHPTAFGHYFTAIDLLAGDATETVIAGDHPDLLHVAHATYLPRNVLLWGEVDENANWEGKTDGAYVCRNQTCGPVAGTPDELRTQLNP
jgi:uncharacterized protein YyaL (SSP411 family)